MKRIILVILLLVIGFAWGAYYIENMRTNQTTVTEETNSIIPVEEEQTFSSETIKEQLADVGFLVTEVYEYTEVETLESDLTINDKKIPLTNSSYIYSYDGRLEAGVNFENINIEVNDVSMVVTITMPDAEIYSNVIDEDSLQVYEEKQGLFNNLTIEQINLSNAQLKEDAENKAVEKGIMERATSNAQAIISQMVFTLLDDDQYQISFTSY